MYQKVRPSNQPVNQFALMHRIKRRTPVHNTNPKYFPVCVLSKSVLDQNGVGSVGFEQKHIGGLKHSLTSEEAEYLQTGKDLFSQFGLV